MISRGVSFLRHERSRALAVIKDSVWFSPCTATSTTTSSIVSCGGTVLRLHSTSTDVPEESSETKVPTKFVPFPFDYQEELDIRIESVTNRGLGIGRVSVTAPKETDDDDNTVDSEATAQEETSSSSRWVVMVPTVIPGELVRVRVFRNFNNYSEADLVQVLEPSPDRVTPMCPLAMDCGGCQLQHMTIESQRQWKTEMVEEALTQYNLQEKATVSPCLGTKEEFAYRSKLTPHYQQPRKSRRGVENVKKIDAIGFQRKTSRQLIDVETCPIATPAVNRAYAAVRERLLTEPPTSKRGATLLLRQGNLDDEHVETNHKAFITTTVDGLSFSYRAGNFFQNNYYVLPLMVEHVVKEAVRGGSMTHLADCYCGSGLFALSAAKHFEKVVGIEINDKAIAEATANAKNNAITNCEFLAASAENIFDVIPNFPRDQSVVVVDPPRKGCSEEFLEQLYNFGPARVVYMSCDPTTQARDAAGLVEHGYKITSVLPFDLFPQTRHIECLMILDRE
eukprot:scaffold2103_cov185-Amphora_coffeaeformis.AAC.20